MIVALALVDGVLVMYASRSGAPAVAGDNPGLDRRVTNVFDVLEGEGLEASLDALERAAATDSAVLRDGHQLSHALGRRAFELAEKGQAVLGECTPVFASGCYHGVVEAFLARARNIDMTVLERMCMAAGTSERPAPVYECVHGLGHGVLGAVDHDIGRALRHCDALPEPRFATPCREGVFMEAINSALRLRDHQGEDPTHEHDPPDGARLALDPGNPYAPCDRFTEPYAGSCWLFQGFVILRSRDFNAAAALRTCEGAPAAMVRRCSESVGFQLTGVFQRDDPWILAQCASARPELAPSCAAGAAAALGAMDWSGARATGFCTAAPLPWKEPCYREVGTSLALRGSPKRRAEVCGGVEPRYSEACRLGGALETPRPSTPG